MKCPACGSETISEKICPRCGKNLKDDECSVCKIPAKQYEKQPTNFKKFESGLLQDPEIRKEYEDLKPKYEMIQSLIKRRNQLRISQSQLARTVGTRQPAISRLERGEFNNVTLITLIKVAHALDLASRKTLRRGWH